MLTLNNLEAHVESCIAVESSAASQGFVGGVHRVEERSFFVVVGDVKVRRPLNLAHDVLDVVLCFQWSLETFHVRELPSEVGDMCL